MFVYFLLIKNDLPLTVVPENEKCGLIKFALVFIAVVAFKDTVYILYNETHLKKTSVMENNLRENTL